MWASDPQGAGAMEGKAAESRKAVAKPRPHDSRPWPPLLGCPMGLGPHLLLLAAPCPQTVWQTRGTGKWPHAEEGTQGTWLWVSRAEAKRPTPHSTPSSRHAVTEYIPPAATRAQAGRPNREEGDPQGGKMASDMPSDSRRKTPPFQPMQMERGMRLRG